MGRLHAEHQKHIGRNVMNQILKNWLPGLLLVTLIVVIAPRAESKTVREEMVRGDREREWAMVYFESWRQARDSDYLVLSRDHMSTAVQIWFELQTQIGHSYPDFYMLDRRRREGCLLLAELDRLASKFRVSIKDASTRGCFATS